MSGRTARPAFDHLCDKRHPVAGHELAQGDELADRRGPLLGRSHEGPPALHLHDEALGLQQLYRVAEGPAGDAKVGGQLGLGLQAMVGRPGARKDSAPGSSGRPVGRWAPGFPC